MDDVIIVGGGIAGLTCAERLRESALRTTVLESESQLGGRVRTSNALGTPVEMGASFFAGFYHEVSELVTEMGVAATTRGDSQETWVCTEDGRAGAVWPARSLLTSSIVGIGGRLRGLVGLLRLLIMSRGVDAGDMGSALRYDDDDVASWGRRAFGREFSAVVIDPLLRALFFWDTEKTSRALLPLILRGVRADKRFLRVDGGMSTIVQKLSERVSYELGVAVTSVSALPDGYLVTTDRGARQTRSVVFTCPAPEVVRILDAGGLQVPSALRAVEYSTIQVKVVKASPNALWPFATRRTIAFTAGASTSLVGLKPIFGGPSDSFLGCRLYVDASQPVQESMDSVVSDLERAGLSELGRMVSSGTLVDEVNWRVALPSFDVGYPRVVSTGALHEGLGRGLFLAGDYTSGPHLEGAVVSGNRAAHLVIAQLLH